MCVHVCVCVCVWGGGGGGGGGGDIVMVCGDCCPPEYVIEGGLINSSGIVQACDVGAQVNFSIVNASLQT